MPRSVISFAFPPSSYNKSYIFKNSKSFFLFSLLLIFHIGKAFYTRKANKAQEISRGEGGGGLELRGNGMIGKSFLAQAQSLKGNVHRVIDAKHFVAVGAFSQPRGHSLLDAPFAKHVSAGLDGCVLEVHSADCADS